MRAMLSHSCGVRSKFFVMDVDRIWLVPDGPQKCGVASIHWIGVPISRAY